MCKEEIKEQLMGLLHDNKKLETTYLNENTDKVEKCEDAAAIITEPEEIRTKKNSIMCFAYQHGKVFQRFKEKEKFFNMVKEFKVNKSTMIFKNNIVKLIDELMKASVTLSFLKTLS